MKQLSSTSGFQTCVEVVDGHSAARDDERGATECDERHHRDAEIKFVRWSSFSPSRDRVEPLLSTKIMGMSQFFGGGSCDCESPGVTRNKLKHHRKSKHPVRNPYQRSYAVVLATLGVVVVMAAYHEVVLGVGISGCVGDAWLEENCDDTLKTFLSRPLVFRQVGHHQDAPPFPIA